jgi:cation:H+ antiporter
MSMEHAWYDYIISEEALTSLFSELNFFLLLLIFIVCVAVLSKGADKLIDGVVGLALRTGLPRIVIGATIVSLGTTMPEAFVSVIAAWLGNPNLALGNGVGSIIADTGLIFGLTVLLAPVPVNRFILNRTGWWQAGSATLLVCIALLPLMLGKATPVFEKWMGVLFLLLLGVYLVMTYVWARKGGDEACCGEQETDMDVGHIYCWTCIILGLLAVVASARVLVACASEMAMRLGVPPDVVAATLVAFGTSLPELMTAITAVRKGHPEIMVGNVVGADVLNCLFVIGAAGSVRELPIAHNFYILHFPVMLLLLYSFRAFIFMQNKAKTFAHWQGGWLLAIYLAYVAVQYTLF